MELTELERARIDSAKDNTRVTPEQLLRLALDDIRRGVVEADACVVLMLRMPKANKAGERNIYRANIDRLEEVAMLEYAKARTLSEWMGDK
jgi:hypothetical protein